MNFLAHIFLSGSDPEIQLGNFLADMVKPKDRTLYSKGFQKGIALHQSIDKFTDHHPIVKESKKVIWDTYRHYSAVLIDIFYDHYLAKNWDEYSEVALRQYVNDFYALMHSSFDELPRGGQHILPFLEGEDWLYNYQYIDGIHRVLQGMSRRASFDSKMEKGAKDLEVHHQVFERHFTAFFPDLQNHVKKEKMRFELPF